MDNYDILDLLSNKKIIIYGAGKIGRRVLYSLKYFGYNVEFFWDNNADILSTIDTEFVLKPDFNLIPVESRKDYAVIITVFSIKVSSQIADILSTHGYNSVICERNIINKFIYNACKQATERNEFVFDITDCHNCPVSKEITDTCDIFNSHLIENLSNNMTFPVDKNARLILPKIGILVSNKCNLSCKGCNHLRELYKKEDIIELTPSEILNDLIKIIEAVDFIPEVTIVGGEAFLHPQLYEIIESILKLPKIGILHIITNGTIKVKEISIFHLLSNKRIIVEISGYGDKIPVALQKNVNNFILDLERHNINYSYMSALQWFYFGDLNKRPYTVEECCDIYSSCCFVSNDLFNGKLHKCSRSVFATHLKKIPDYPEDYINLRNCQQLRSKLFEFLNNQCPKICFHCNGTSTLTIEAGCQ